MRKVNLSGLDLNLLPPLRALLLRCNVSQAAADVGLSQPAMSRALARLRDVLGDPLLVRAPGGYVLSALGQSMLPKVSAMLDQMQHLFEQSDFDPAQVRRTIRLIGSDAQTILLMPPLLARLAREAPGIDVRFDAYGPDTVTRMLSGAADFTFSLPSVALPPGAMSQSIGFDRYALVMRRAHPASQQPWRLEDYGRYDSVGVSILGDGQSSIDTVLAGVGVTRRVAARVPHFLGALACVAQSDLVTTLSAQLAGRFARQFDLILRDVPLPDPVLELHLVWSHLKHHDPVLQWFRGVLAEEAMAVYRADQRGLA